MPGSRSSSSGLCPDLGGDQPAGVAVRRCAEPPSRPTTNGVCSHDDIASVMGRKNRPDRPPPIAIGWSTRAARRRRPPRAAASSPRSCSLPLVFGLLGAPVRHPDRAWRRADRRQGQAGRAREGDRGPEGARSRRSTPCRPASRPRSRNTTQAADGINADLTAVRKTITKMESRHRRGQGQLHRLVAQLAALDNQLAVISRGGRQEAASCASARRCWPSASGGLRHRPDVAARDVPVGRLLHRRARRGQLHHRRRRAGQGARRADRQRPGDARRAPPDGRRHARPDRRPAPGDGRPEARSSTASSTTSRRPRPSSSSSRGDAKAPRDPEGALRRARRATRRTSPRPSRDAAAARSARRARSTSSSQAGPARQHPVAVQRHAELADGRRRDRSEFGCTLVSRATRRATAAPTSTTASTSSPPYGAPVKASGAGRVGYVGWNYADGADPAWIVIIVHSRTSRPGTPT